MVLNIKVSKGVEYLYFQAGRTSIYIGPREDPGKAKADNVIKALDYARGRMDHYDESFAELLPFLPSELRERQIAKESTRLQGKIARYRKKIPAKSRK